MNIADFFRRLTAHITLALASWYVAALALERLVPGFVSPFVNLPGVGLVLLGVAAVALAVAPEADSRLAKAVSCILLALLLGLACLFLWSRLNDLGGLGLLLAAAAVIASVLACVATWSRDDQA